MCFSATASFASATLLVLAGGVAVQRTRQRSEWPYALIPLIFGLQQALEGLIWLTLDDHAARWSCLPAADLVWGYSFFAQAFWPLYVPLAVYLIETVAWRRQALMLTGLAGMVVSMFLLAAMVQQPVHAYLQGQHIVYEFGHTHVLLASLFYLTGSCVSPLLSSHASVRWFGLTASATALYTFLVYKPWFTSVWCYFAGLMSCVVLLHFFQASRHPAARVDAGSR